MDETSILAVAIALHQFFFFQPVDDTDDGAGAEEDLLRQSGAGYRAVVFYRLETSELRAGNLMPDLPVYANGDLLP